MVATTEKQYLEIFRRLSKEEQHLVNQSLQRLVTEQEEPSSNREASLAEAIAGGSFSRQERIQLEMATLAQHFQRRRQLLAGAFTASQVAEEILGTSRQTPHDRVAHQSLLAVRDNGKLRFPYWQFDPEGPDAVIEGFPEVLRALQLSDYAKLVWLTRANPYLENLTPLEALKQGKKEQVIEQARSVQASQWS